MKVVILFFLLSQVTTFGQVKPEDVQIARDSFGVPHIFGKSDAATAYGLAWAHAEDDFANIELTLLAGKGMLGKAIGRKGAEADYVVYLLRCRDIVREKINTLSPAFIEVISGYVQGLNDYARTHPEELRVKKAFPASIEDYLTTVTFSLSMISGLEELLPRIFSGNIDILPGLKSAGSNAFAIHPSKTTTGEAFLAINSHQPLEGPVAWYEAHLQSDEGLNIIGGLFPGAPCIFLGVNEHLGWAHTVNMMDKVDVYQLKMKQGKKKQYEFDGQWIDLEMRTVKLKVKGIPVTVKKKVWWSKYGATVINDKGAFSLRFTANQDITGLEQWWKMNKAKNFTEFYKALSMQGLPMFNIVYADKYDTIFYMSGGKMPLRDSSNKYVWTSTLPGNTSATLWNTFHPIADLPQYINPKSGYLYNTNHSPFLASAIEDNLNPDSYDRTSNYERYHNNRSERFYELISETQKISYTDFKKIKYDNQLPKQLKYVINIDSINLLSPADHPDIADVLSIYQQWDRKTDTGSQGAAVFKILYDYVVLKMKIWPNKILNNYQIIETFNHVRNYHVKYFGHTGITLGDLQKHVRGEKEYPSWGIPDVLTAMYSSDYRNGRLKVRAGESYIELVRFPKDGLPIIESVNCYGASNRKDSPHFDDQMEMFLNKQTKPMSLEKEKVLREAKIIYHPGEK